LATLFIGTGDREHPTYTMIRNRIYAIYDDSEVTVDYNNGYVTNTYNVSSAPYTEDDLLNLTCDELDIDTTIDSLPGQTALNSISDPSVRDTALKDFLRDTLLDDAVYPDAVDSTDHLEAAEVPVHEDDAKGWYIILDEQGDATACSHCTYSGGYNVDSHLGEKILSKPSLYYNTVYFTSYQPSSNDPCNPNGNGYVYALDYLDGTSALNLNTGNDTADPVRDVTDRYRKYTGIQGIPSGFNIVTRNGHAEAMASMGGKIVGPGENTPGGVPPYEIPSPGFGLELYYWFEGNTNK